MEVLNNALVGSSLSFFKCEVEHINNSVFFNIPSGNDAWLLYNSNHDDEALNIYFVNFNATGLNNGSSWANAFLSLNSALQLAQNGDEIWVAKGVYQPTINTDRSASFQVPCGTHLFGGFAGNETSVSQRDFLVNVSILDGNIGDDAIATDNVYHLVYAENCDSITLIDGFTIANGYANGIGKDGMGGGILFNTDNTLVETTPVIQNCVIQNNYAVRGGGFSSLGDLYGLPGIKIKNTRFFRNKSQLDGGAIHSNGQINSNQQIALQGCVFSECRSFFGSGGAVGLETFGGNFLLEACIFEKDSTKIGLVGGGLNIILAESNSTINIKNCQFRNCFSAGGGGLFVEDYGYQNSKYFLFNVYNTTFDDNRSYNTGGAVLITNGLKTIAYLTFDKVIFENNHAAGEGAGIEIYNQRVGELYITLANSKFIENRGNAPGGGAFTLINIQNTGLTINKVLIYNCLFSGNRGAYSLTTGDWCQNNTYILNSIFVDNSRYVFNKTWFPTFDGTTRYNFMDINNCVIIDTTDIKRIFYNNNFNSFSMHDYRVDNCLLSKPDCIFEGGSICGDHMLYNLDPEFLPNSFVPDRCSPLVNTGNNIWPDSFHISNDLLQNARIWFDTVDIGAYELTTPCVSGLSAELEDTFLGFILLKNPLKIGEPIPIFCNEGNTALIDVEIINAQGQRVSTSSVANDQGGRMSLPGMLRSGIFFIRFQNKHYHQTLKLIVSD